MEHNAGSSSLTADYRDFCHLCSGDSNQCTKDQVITMIEYQNGRGEHALATFIAQVICQFKKICSCCKKINEAKKTILTKAHQIMLWVKSILQRLNFQGNHLIKLDELLAESSAILK